MGSVCGKKTTASIYSTILLEFSPLSHRIEYRFAQIAVAAFETFQA